MPFLVQPTASCCWSLTSFSGEWSSHASKCIGCCLHHVISASMGLAPSCVELGATLCWHSRKVSLDGDSSLLSLIRVTRIVTPADLVCGRRIKELYSYQVHWRRKQVDRGGRTLVLAVRSECFVICATWTISLSLSLCLKCFFSCQIFPRFDLSLVVI